MGTADAQAFDAFCTDQHGPLVGALHLYCGDLGVAEQLAQTAFERAWQRWDRVGGMASPGGWVRQVAFNLARSGFRRRAAERRAYARHGRDAPTPAVDSATVVAVREALAALPHRQRAVLIHRFYGGLSVAEAAEVMGISEGAAKQLSFRGAAHLRELLGDEDLLAEEVERDG